MGSKSIVLSFLPATVSHKFIKLYLTASQKVHLPFEKLTVPSNVEALTALSKTEGLYYASSFVAAAYCKPKCETEWQY
jgi:hypothetical protein